jgi:dolichol-phosphate mannosyltransferase
MIYILLPAYNEKLNLLRILKKINTLIKKTKYNIKIIIIDDGSSDETIKIFLKFKKKNNIVYKRHQKNLGLHKALDTGFKYILSNAKKKDIIVTLDSDNTHPIEDLPSLINCIKNGADVVIASRFVAGSKIIGLKFHRILLSYMAAYMFKIFFSLKNVSDYTCSYRAYKCTIIFECYKHYKNFISEKSFSCVADILLKINKINKNINFKEVPLCLKYNLKIGSSKMKVFRTIIRTILLIVKRKFSGF